MGAVFGKKRKRVENEDKPLEDEWDDEEEIVKVVRKTFNENTEIFLLNNLLLSVQFFENYEREIQEVRAKNQIHSRELVLNDALRGYQKHCILPDTVMESVNKRVCFRPVHGTKKLQSEPLITQRIYLIHDNIEVINDEEENAEYSIVEGPIHRSVLEDVKIGENRSGYVKVERTEIRKTTYEKNVSNEDVPVQNDLNDSDEEPSKTKPEAPSTKSSPGLSFKHIVTETPSSPGVLKKYPRTSSSPLHKEVQFQFPDPEKPSLKNKNLRTSFTKPKSPKSKNISFEIPKQEEEYGYTTIRRLTSQKSLEEVRAGKQISDITSLPEKCITSIEVKKNINDVDSSDEDEFDENGRRRPPVIKKKLDFYETKHYINSEEFFKHFGDVFKEIYEKLGFTKEAQTEATTQSSIIYINHIDEQGNRIPNEIYPCVATPWPQLAYAWLNRKRNAYWVPTINKAVQWPPSKTVTSIRKMLGVVLPVGYMPKRGINENFHVEWSLAFPAVERHLESCLSHAQMRCYLFIMAIYKTFIEVPNPKLGLSPHHIRHIIFWEIEHNWTTWQEENLGSKMVFILQKIHDYLSKGSLPDYFIEKRNLLENTPSKYLHVSLEKIHRIIEKPFLYTLLALRNIRYTSGTFFPTLDIKKLYEIVTTQNTLSVVNPALAIMTLKTEEMLESDEEEMNEFKENRKTFWEKCRENEDLDLKWKRKLRRQIDMEKKEVKKVARKEKRESVDSINLQFHVTKEYFDPAQPENTLRRRQVLEFFMEHFLSMAKQCIKHHSFNFCMMYLNHCETLSTLAKTDAYAEDLENKVKVKIQDLKEECQREFKQVVPPVIPERRPSERQRSRTNSSNASEVTLRREKTISLPVSGSSSTDNDIKFNSVPNESNFTVNVDIHQTNIEKETIQETTKEEIEDNRTDEPQETKEINENKEKEENSTNKTIEYDKIETIEQDTKSKNTNVKQNDSSEVIEEKKLSNSHSHNEFKLNPVEISSKTEEKLGPVSTSSIFKALKSKPTINTNNGIKKNIINKESTQKESLLNDEYNKKLLNKDKNDKIDVNNNVINNLMNGHAMTDINGINNHIDEDSDSDGSTYL